MSDQSDSQKSKRDGLKPWTHDESERAANLESLDRDRLATLYDYGILDSGREEAFDRISRIAALALDAPMSFVNFVDASRVWFKATVGVDLPQCERDGSFCGLTVEQQEPLVVPDTLQDPRFSNNPFVAGPAKIRAYLGVPIKNSKGVAIGTVCVFDVQPREFTQTQVQLLEDLADAVLDALELRYRTGMAVNDSNERLEAIASFVPGIVYQFQIDGEGTWSFQYISPAVERALGLRPHDVTIDPQIWFNAVHSDDRDRLLTAIRQSHLTLDLLHWEGRVINGKGETLWFRCAAMPRKLEGGAVCWNGLFLDSTDQVETQRRLSRAQKMEAVGQLTGGIAHDFNNLLSVIIGNSDRITANPADAPDCNQAILRAAKNGAQLTQHLLAFARQQPLQPQSVDLDKLVYSLSGLFSRILGESIEVHTEIAADLWSAKVDAAQLENALLNLALNARDAMPGGGKLIISCHNARLNQARNLEGEARLVGDFTVLAVSDTGCGMSQEVRERSFEPFFTTKSAGKGSGLGLSMVFGFAQQSGGHVTVESEEGAGTVFSLYLPMAERVEEAHPADQLPTLGSQGGGKILVIEDNRDVQDITVQMIEDLGYQAVAALNAEAARSIIEQDDTIDLVLSDVVLPNGVSGPDLARELCESLPGLSFVFMSGYPADVVEGRGLLDEGATLLKKPFRRNDLAQTLRTAFDQKSAESRTGS
ncbi:MAG: ATP-binding protein [Pseudomonadota bacterium]